MTEQQVKKEEKTKKGEDKTTKMLVSGIFASIFVILFLLISSIAYGVRQASENSFIVEGSKILRIPVASINGSGILYHDYITDLEALRMYNLSAGEATQPEEDSDRALSRLFINTIVSDLIEEYDLEISAEEFEKTKQQLKDQFKTEEEMNRNLIENFGWNFDIFVDRVLKPQLKEQKLAEAFTNNQIEGLDQFGVEQLRARHILFQLSEDEDQEDTLKKANSVLERVKGGESFEELAVEFGSDSTKDQGGDLGWFERGQMIPEFEEAVFALEPGQTRDSVLETDYGFHIIKLEEKRNVNNFNAFMDSNISSAKVKLFSKIHNPFEDPEISVIQ